MARVNLSELPEEINPLLAFKSFFESAPLMMGIADLEGSNIRHVFDNEAAIQFFQMKSPIQGQLATDLGISNVIIDLWIKNYLLCEKNKKPVRFEYRHRTQESDKILSVVVSSMGKSPSGKSRFSYVAQDVTEARISEDILEEKIKSRTHELEIQKKKLFGLINSSPVGVAFLDKDLRYDLVNPIIAEMNGVSSEAHMGRTVEEVLPELPESNINLLKDVIEKRKTFIGVEYESFTKFSPGKKHIFIANYFPVEVEKRIIGVGVTVIDLTEQKEIENAKSLQEQGYKYVVEAVKDHAIIRFDTSGRILDWNAGAENIFQYKKAEAIGKHGSLIFTPEDRAHLDHVTEMEVALKTGKAEDERYHVRKDGTLLFAMGSLYSLNDSTGTLLGFVKVLRDETLKKLAEERFKVATMETSVGVWEYDLTTKKFWRSESHAKIYGFNNSVSDMNMEEITEFVHPDDRKEMLSTFTKSITERKELNQEFRVIWPDGSLHWLGTIGRMVTDRAGEPFKMVGTIHDITDRKLAQVSVEASKKELESVFMQAPVPLVILTGPDFYFSLANPPYEKLIGRKAQGKYVLDVFNEEEIKIFLPLVKEVYRTGKPFIGKELPLQITDEGNASKTRFLDFGYYPYVDNDGSIMGVLAVVNDVTEQVKARKILEESEFHFRQLANSLPAIIWTATASFEVDWYNDWWFNYLSMPKGTTWDNKDLSPMHPDDIAPTRLNLEESRRTGKDFNMEQRFRRGSDGSYRWHVVRGVPVKDQDGRVIKWVGANTDVHDQKLLLQKLEEERDLREHFVATLSHDLRTPLTAAKMNAQIIARKSNDPDRVMKGAIKIEENLNRADTMIRDLLDASRVKAGQKLQMEMSECHLNTVISEVIEELSTIHGDRFKKYFTEDIVGEWSCSGIRRILENLCNNAIKYGSPTLPITISAIDDKKCILIKVHNEGNPISVKDQRTLFEPFKRAASPETLKEKGWGLGLTLVKGLAEAHGGSISVESALETGTTFTVKIPRMKP
jgi:PAS domain S-box-containing protein